MIRMRHACHLTAHIDDTRTNISKYVHIFFFELMHCHFWNQWRKIIIQNYYGNHELHQLRWERDGWREEKKPNGCVVVEL